MGRESWDSGGGNSSSSSTNSVSMTILVCWYLARWKWMRKEEKMHLTFILGERRKQDATTAA